jgi:hypothetical protein
VRVTFAYGTEILNLPGYPSTHLRLESGGLP